MKRSSVAVLALAGYASAPAVAPAAMYHFPRWSPDGEAIVVHAMGERDPELYLFRLDGSPPSTLTDDLELDDDAVSPDGRTRLVESIIDGRSAIVAEHADGTSHVLTTGPHAEQPSFSPSGEQIAYEQRSVGAPDDIARSNIVVAGADGSAARIVSSGTDPSWSPDGKTLLFKIWVEPAASEGSGGRLWIATASVDGRTVRRLAPGVHPNWSPDGRRIAYMVDDGKRTDIWVMDADGTGQACLTCRY